MTENPEDILRAQLKRWGIATVNRYARRLDGPSAGDSVLAKTFKVANGKKVDRELVKRDGSDRRAIMATAANRSRDGKGVGLVAVPKWACEPIRAANDADPPHDREPVAVDVGIPEELRWLDRAISQMERQHPIRAKCLREEFTGQGSQRIKAARVAEFLEGGFTVWMYRKEIERGVQWILGAKDAKAA